ncbi:uncharacterized protein LOC130504220 [Raphanus sativus]|uniref:Uncharacterized protein LOC130504220 n=1 Tax=Raphanus sativus TaxID=3726 RepID=A0A9W3CTH0_RAPSA|nr:uncharacterized protein LOC130504220 [Raphanus sativus]XP_056854787.1 uncharacterized protein LOC130504220 [Raphanus sativus]XP_056854788.1 uncharacterized protein LOC130504220 [Raphanus sativus]XP_056854789.1 uncharacterized protein LOC130504220 [Raphanus sativus]XP_056854790.1 uncharacterized protein LOC130504220 [Raphanus sativus]
MRKRITLKKKSDPRKFAIPCVVQGIEFPHALCDTGSLVSILPKVMADHLGLKVELSLEIFTFVDYTQKYSGGLIRDLEMQIGNAIVPVNFHVLNIKLNWNSFLLHGKAFMATVGAICDMNTNRMCLTMIDPDIHYDPVKLGKPPTKTVEKEDDLGIIAVFHCEVEYETEYSGSIDNISTSSIDTSESEEIDTNHGPSIDRRTPDDELDLPDHCYPNFAIPPNRKEDDYSVRSWADSGFHESFALDIARSSQSENHIEEYDEDYWDERAWENYMENDRFANRFPKSIDIHRPPSIDYLLHPAKRHRPSIDIASITSIDIDPDDLKDKIGISPIRTTDGYIRLSTQATKFQTSTTFTQQLPATSNITMEDCNTKNNRSNHGARRSPSMATITAPSIDALTRAQSRFHDPYDIRNVSLTPDEFGIFRDTDGFARALDGRVLHITREDIADILQVANGPENLFTQRRGHPDILTHVQDNHHVTMREDTVPQSFGQPRSSPSVDIVSSPSIDGELPRSIDRARIRLPDRRLEFGRRAFDSNGSRRFKWEAKDEFGVHRDEFGHARGVDGEIIPVTKEHIRRILERASIFHRGCLRLPEHTRLYHAYRPPPVPYSREEIDDMVTDVWRAQAHLEADFHTLVEDTFQPLDSSYESLQSDMAVLRMEIKSIRTMLEKEATPQVSIDTTPAPSIDIGKTTSKDQPECSSPKRDEWEIAYINTRIGDVYSPLNNNVEWLSKRIDLLQKELATIREKIHVQNATIPSNDTNSSPSIDTRFAAMEDGMKSYEERHDHFSSPIMRYLDTLSQQLNELQQDIGIVQDHLGLRDRNAASIDRPRPISIDIGPPPAKRACTAAEVDHIKHELYEAMNAMEE